MRQSHQELVVLGDEDSRHGSNKVRSCPSLPPEMAISLPRDQCTHDLSQIVLNLVQEKKESMELAQFKHQYMLYSVV